MGNSSFRNLTTQEEALTTSEISLVCMYSAIFTLGVIGNGLVIFVTGYKMKMTINSIWFFNLAVADFIFILTLILRILWICGIWIDDFADGFVKFMEKLNMFASIFFLTVISLDRCLCTWMVVWAQNKRTLVKAKTISIFVWLLSIGCSVPFFIDDQDVTTHEFVVAFLLPFLIIASSYICVGVRLKRLKRVKLRPFLAILSVTLAFFMCWFPMHVVLFCEVALENELDNLELILEIKPFVICLCYLNSCLNPILYVFMCEEYKKKLKQSLVLVLEMAFAEDYLAFRTIRQTNISTSEPSRPYSENTSGFKLHQ